MTRHLPSSSSSSHCPRSPQQQQQPPLATGAASSSAVDQSFERPTAAKDVVDLLILGAGWTSSFLIPLLKEEHSTVSWAATTRDGRNDTIPFTFDPASKDDKPYKALPRARTVLITFPLKGVGQSKRLLELYWKAHRDSELKRNWIQLGSTGIYKDDGWSAWDSPYDKTNDRAIAEDELLECVRSRACVLNFAGLYGGQRQLRHWLPRVARSKEEAAGKGAVHMVHGRDVSRAIIAAHLKLVEEYASPVKAPTPDSESPFPYLTADNQAPAAASATSSPTAVSLPDTLGGHRFPITDLHCYDWWDLFMQFGQYARQRAMNGETAAEVLKGAKPEALLYEKWVLELMDEKGIRALPRDKTGEGLGRLVDGRAFWAVAEARPLEGRADRRTNEED